MVSDGVQIGKPGWITILTMVCFGAVVRKQSKELLKFGEHNCQYKLYIHTLKLQMCLKLYVYYIIIKYQILVVPSQLIKYINHQWSFSFWVASFGYPCVECTMNQYVGIGSQFEGDQREQSNWLFLCIVNCKQYVFFQTLAGKEYLKNL